MIFLTSPYVDFETGAESKDHGLLCFSPADGETEEDADWVLSDSEDVWLTEAQADELAAWANERFASANYESFDGSDGFDELVAKAHELA